MADVKIRVDYRLRAQHRWLRLMRRGKYWVGRDPILLPVLLRLTPLGISRRITQSTALVVEGFPRGGNTFTVFALQDAVDHRLRISSHVHLPSQVKHAVARGIPVLLVVREPVALLSSYLVYGPHATPKDVLQEYTSYHRQLVPYIEQLLICDFEDIIRDMSSVIVRINDRYGLNIPPFDQSPANVQRVFARIGQHHRLVHPHLDPGKGIPYPSTSRSGDNARYREQLLDPRHRKLLVEARDLYQYFATSGRQ